jgi:hypothetical protein
VEDEDLSPKMWLHITFKVVSQLDKAEDFRLLSPEELSLGEFLIEQIHSLQLVVEAQDDAPSLSQEPPQPEMDDECLTPEILLHIAFEVISQLGKAEESMWLSPEALSLRDFLVEQLWSLQLVIEGQGIATSLIQTSVASAQDPLPSQPTVALVSRCSGTMTLLSLDLPVRDGGQVVDLSVSSSGGRDTMLPPSWQQRKPLWDALGMNLGDTLLLVPLPISVPPPSGRCSYGVCSNSKIDVCVKFSGVVVGRMKVVKYVKMKPHEVAPMEMLLLRVVHRTLRQVVLSPCKPSRKLEWHHPQLVR